MKIIVIVATPATAGAYANEPTSTRNSPTNPDRPGRPTDASMKKPNVAA